MPEVEVSLAVPHPGIKPSRAPCFPYHSHASFGEGNGDEGKSQQECPSVQGFHHTLTAQTPFPPVTPTHSPPLLLCPDCGDQLRFDTSKSQRHAAAGPRASEGKLEVAPLLEPTPPFSGMFPNMFNPFNPPMPPIGPVIPVPGPATESKVAELLGLIRSQYRTCESSPPLASIPRRVGDQSMLFTDAECPWSSSSA